MTAALVHQMIDRARDFRTMEMHDERLLALGKLASGLAHELNNPASGAARALTSLLEATQRSSRALAAAGLSEAQLAVMDAVCVECRGAGGVRYESRYDLRVTRSS